MNAPFSLAKSAQRDAFIAFVCDENSAETLRGVASDHGWPVEKIMKGGLRNAVQTLSVSASPHVLFVDLSESGDPLNDINGLAEVCEPGTIVIAMGQVNDVRLYRDLLSSGIHDYLLKPLNPDMVRESIAQAHALLHAPKAAEASVERPHCAVAVIGTRGGAGASTIATSLAWLSGEQEKRSTALLDLDVHFGTGALGLDLEPGRGLTDAIENPSRIDGLFIERAMVRAGERLSVLSAEAPINAPIQTDGAAFYQLQEEMRAAFETTIVDLPRTMLVSYPHLVEEVQTAVIVTELTLAAARDTIRLLSWFRSNAPHITVVLVGNKVQPAANQEITRKDFEGSVERKLDFLLPWDGKLAAQAAKLGKPLAEAGKGNRALGPLVDLSRHLCRLHDAADDDAADGAAKGKGKGKDGTSLIGKLAGLRARLPARAKK